MPTIPEIYRQCAKCGVKADANISLHRFPPLGKTNISRVRAWATFCYPNEDWSSTKSLEELWKQHKLLCSNHFADSAYTCSARKRLNKFSVPTERQDLHGPSMREYHLDMHTPAGPFTREGPSAQDLLEAGPSTKEYHLEMNTPTGSFTREGPSARDLLEAGPSTREYGLEINTPTGSFTREGPSARDLMEAGPSTREYDLEINTPTGSFTREGPSARDLLEAGPSTREYDLEINAPTGSFTREGPSARDLLEAGPSTREYDLEINTPTLPEPTKDLLFAFRRDHDYELRTGDISTTQVPPRKRKGIIRELDVRKVSELSPREQTLYIKCRKSLSEIARLRNKFKKIKSKLDKRSAIIEDLATNANIQTLLGKRITGPFALLLQSQLINTPRKIHGRRWKLDDKILALGIYKKSSACYRLLRRLICLPSENTLKNLLNQVPLKCGINSKIFDTIKGIAEKRGDEDNMCIVAFDEMSIRKNLNYNSKLDQIDGFQDHGRQGRSMEVATHALLFMAIGLRKKWKQPLAFYFSGDTVTADRLSVLIKEVLSECFRVGLTVLGTVCDLDGGNLKAINLLGSSKERPYFDFNGHELVTILDPPHLLKCFRNMFLKYNIKCDEDIQVNGKTIKGVAKWSHIEDFFEKDYNNPNFVYAPSLTRQHLDPNGKQKMKVKFAAEVLSHSVASGLYAKIGSNELQREATATARIVENMDQIFDALNADSQDLKKGKRFLTNITDRSPHLKYFKEMIYFFDKIIFVGARSRPPSQDGWIRTLKAVQRLYLTLKKNDINSLSTRRLNQDPLENCFGCIRNNCGCNPNPNTIQFIAALKTSILSNLLHTGTKRNCEDDNNVILDDFKAFICNKNMDDIVCASSSVAENEIEGVEGFLPEIDFQTAEIQACTYVCGYILKKMAPVCRHCKSAMIAQEIDVHHLFVYFKEYDQNKESLMYVKKEFAAAVEMAATIINDFLKSKSSSSELKTKLFSKLIKEITFDWLSECCDHYENNVKQIINYTFSICIRRYCVLENRKFIDEASKKAFRRKINIIRHA